MIALMLLACAPPDSDELFVHVTPAPTIDEADANAAFAAVADEASHTLTVALPALTDAALTDAVLAAADRGVAVEVLVDFDHADDAGVLALTDAMIPVSFADADVTFFDFDLNTEVTWGSDQAKMTHAFVVADLYRWATATRAGGATPGPVAVFDGRGEDIAEILSLEHNQVFGGTDATAATAFNGLAKSLTDPRVSFNTQEDELMEVHFGPQDRLVKRLTDAVYAARSSIRVMTEDIADEGFARALQHKARDGFDVEVIVGPTFGGEEAGLSAVLTDQTPGVVKLRSTEPGALSTVLYIDFDRARDGAFHRPRVITVTHPIYSAGRTFSERTVTTDQLIDGTMIVYKLQGSPSAPQQELATLYRDVRATAEEL